MKRYLIIGNGIAGATAADKIRFLDPEGDITIITDEKKPLYYRIRLPEVLAGEIDLDKITLRSEDYYRQKQIKLHLGETVTDIDSEKKTVTCASGLDVAYDALLLANGAHCFVPPVPGADKPGVFTLRNYNDALRISETCRQEKSAILIGGGLLGLEAGYGLIRLGLKVRVVEIFDRLLPRQMDKVGADILQNKLEHLGFEFFLAAKSKEIIGGKQAEGLLLDDGQTLSSKVILFSAGIRNNLDLAQKGDIDCNRGILVNDALETSQPSIWAAGDVAEHRGQCYGIWAAAMKQGEIAGKNMAGASDIYKGTVMTNSLKVVGIDLTSAGNIDPDNVLPAAIYQDENVYRKVVMDQGRIVGFIFLGVTAGVKECQAALEQGIKVGSWAEAMGIKDFDFSKLS